MVKIEIKEKTESKLLGRLEISGKVVFEGATPANNVVKEMLAAEVKADKNLVIIKHIYSKFSHQEADFLAYVYTDAEKMNKMEVMTKHLKKKAEEGRKKLEEEKKAAEEETKKKAGEEQKAAAEKPAEEKEGEAPAEEKKKDEPTVEEKTEEKKD